MTGIRTRASRITLLIAVFAAILMFASPVLQLGNNNVDLNAVDNASASGPGDRTLRVGWVAFQDMMKTLNPFLYTWGAESTNIWLCMSTLMTYDENQKLVGDLATNWTISDGGLTWTIKITKLATFYDRLNPTAYNPLTSADVKFSFLLAQEQDGNHLQAYFPLLPGAAGRLISSIDTPDDWTVVFHIRSQYAPFASAFTTIPIFPQYIWSTRAWNWANFDFKKAPNVPPIVGSGPFYYALDGLPTAGTVELRRSPTWFQNEERGYDIHVDRLFWITETEATNYAAYQNGDIDIIANPTVEQWGIIGPGAIGGSRWTSSQGYVWEFNMNQMTDTMRASLGGAYARGTNSQLLLDDTVKTALKMCVDKQFVAHNVLADTARPADSLAPQSHPFYYNYGSNPTLDTKPISVSAQGARQKLFDAGWKYDLNGNLLTSDSSYYPLSKKTPGGVVTDTLRFRFITPNTDTNYDPTCVDIRDRARLAGIDLTYTGASTAAAMDNAWATADYDCWVWNWWMTPVYDISTEIMIYFTTESIPIGWSDVYYSNPAYDELYYQSLSAMNPVDRKLLTDELQRMGYEDSGCWPVVWIDFLYAAQPSSVGPDHWTNYGDWSQHFPLTVDSWYYWLFMNIEPDNTITGVNGAPAASVGSPRYVGDTDNTRSFSASVQDDNTWDTLEYRWNFGDGTNTSWLTPTADGAYGTDHKYAQDGYYDVYFMVREKLTQDKFGSWAQTMAVIYNNSNTAPHGQDFTIYPDPSSPDSGTIVYFNGSATDDQGDNMTYKWNFGDGTTGAGQNVTHQFTKGAGGYTVYIYVDDGHLGQGPRPVTNSHVVSVTDNNVPTCVPKAEPAVQKGTSWKFTATVSDVDSRDRLRLTWDWGDGTTDTVMNEAGPITSPTPVYAYHTYKFSGDFTMTVSADDKTGLSDHNVSRTALIHVARIGNRPPVITNFHVSNSVPTTDDVVTFYGTVTDVDGDPCILNFTFGDGTWEVVSQTVANETLTVTHVYSMEGFYAAYLDATDGQGSAPTNGPVIMTPSQAFFTLNLASGWNFVSIPRVDWGYNASNLGLVTGDTVVRYDTLTGNYDLTYDVGYSGSEKDFALNPSTGYWIYAAAPRTLELYGNVSTTTQTRFIDVPEAGGWAMVGFASLSTTRHASDIPSMYSGASITFVVAFISGAYLMYDDIEPTYHNFLLVPGQAYWVWCTSGGTLAYDP